MHMHSVQYYSAAKNKRFMGFAGNWVDLDGIIISKVVQAQKHPCTHTHAYAYT